MERETRIIDGGWQNIEKSSDRGTGEVSARRTATTVRNEANGQMPFMHSKRSILSEAEQMYVVGIYHADQSKHTQNTVTVNRSIISHLTLVATSRKNRRCDGRRKQQQLHA